MPNIDIIAIRDKITTHHGGDERQLEVIFSDSPRLIVEAPAGYGKTTTMISRIAYLFAIGGIPNPKRILGLTFSTSVINWATNALPCYITPVIPASACAGMWDMWVQGVSMMPTGFGRRKWSQRIWRIVMAWFPAAQRVLT